MEVDNVAYNYHNELCHQCSELVFKGEGLRIWVKDGGWVTMCQPCGKARTKNKGTAVSRKAAIKRQPTLFSQ